MYGINTRYIPPAPTINISGTTTDAANQENYSTPKNTPPQSTVITQFSKMMDIQV